MHAAPAAYSSQLKRTLVTSLDTSMACAASITHNMNRTTCVLGSTDTRQLAEPASVGSCRCRTRTTWLVCKVDTLYTRSATSSCRPTQAVTLTYFDRVSAPQHALLDACVQLYFVVQGRAKWVYFGQMKYRAQICCQLRTLFYRFLHAKQWRAYCISVISASNYRLFTCCSVKRVSCKPLL